MKEITEIEPINIRHAVFRQVHDYSANIVIALGTDKKIVYANPMAVKISGTAVEQLIGRSFSLLFADTSVNQINVQSILNNKTIAEAEFELITLPAKEQYVLISSAVYEDPDNITNTYLFIRDISLLKKKEHLLSFLNTATEDLARIRDTQSALNQISKLIVPRFASWFTIDMIRENRLELLILAHENPDKIEWALEYRKNYPTDLNGNSGVARVAKTGVAGFVPVVTADMITATITDPKQLEAVQQIGLQSVITVAMSNKEKITGIISFISSKPGHYYDETDLRFAQNMANHIGLALENSRLNEEAQTEISNRKQIEDKLRIIQKQLKLALSSGLVGTWVRDLKKNVLYPDESFSQMFGIPFSPNGCDPAFFEEAIYPADRGLSLNNRLHALSEGEILEAEYRVLKEEAIHWFFIRGKVEYDADQQEALLAGVGIDVTNRKQAEIALRESEERYSATFFNASVGILLSGVDGKLIKSNPAFTSITGYTEGDLEGKDFSAITHNDDLEENTLLYQELFRQERPNFIIEKRYWHKNGTIIWVRNSTSLVCDADGKPAYSVSFTEDITAQKRAEVALKKSEELFRLLAETMPQKMFSTDHAGKMEYLNPQWEQFTGMTVSEINAVTLAHFIHPEGYEDNLEKWYSAIATGENFVYEHRFRNKEGKYIWHLTRALPLKDEKGEVIRWVGTMTDINEQKEKESKKDEFISIASHELKTPLTILKAFFQLIKKEITAEFRFYSLSIKADRQLNRLERLIEDLLDVSKINAGKMQYNLEDFNFKEVIIDAIESVQGTSLQHKIEFTSSVDIIFRGDRYRIEQVVINLLNNAVKYSPNADKVIVTCVIEQNNIIVAVKDFGIGISPDHLGELFDRFYRVDNLSNRFQGLGLGLFIASEIVKRHGGSLRIESEPEKGSVFYFGLPLS